MLNFLSYVGVSSLLLLLGSFLFVLSTPKINEFALIKNGNVTAALSLGGKLIGLSLVLGSSIANSVSLKDLAIWGAIGILSQIILYYLVELAFYKFNLNKAVEEDNRAIGTLLLTISIAVGWTIAQCLTY